MWVSPFRYPRIVEYLLLPVAFRSLSRLSSALSAKASTLRSFQLNLLTSGAGCSLHLRLQRQTLRSWFLTLASSLYFYNEGFRKSFNFLPLVLDVSIFYRFRSLYSVFKVQLLLSNNHNEFTLLIASVEMVRFELMTPCLQGRCSPN